MLEDSTTHRHESFDKLLGTLVVFEMLQNEHDEVVVLELSEILDHLAFDKRLQLAVNHGL